MKGQNRRRQDSAGQEAEALLLELSRDPRILQMKQYTQHGRVSTYEHSLAVARLSLLLARGLLLKVDGRQLVRGAVLHDYYLYDWHVHGDKLHGYHHPEIAARQAQRDFSLTQKEQEIIRTHMWPLTLRRVPSSREAALVCLADKLCSVKETALGLFAR